MTSLLQQAAGRNGWGVENDDLDNLFQGFFRPLRAFNPAQSQAQSWVLPMDVTERENEYVIYAELPGVNKDNIDITLADGVLTVSAETKQEYEEKEGDRLVRQERRYGKYSRSIRLGTQIDEKNVKANYKDGVLELVLPKAEEVKPKKIAVK